MTRLREMRLLVAGSRGYDCARVWQDLDSFDFYHPDWIGSNLDGEVVFVHGGCPDSPDEWASKWAATHGYAEDVFEAEWGTHGKAAGPIRNSAMIASGVDLVFAFWDGKSRGTKDTIDKALAAGLEVRIFPPERSNK